MSDWRIDELAQRTGVSVDTLRYYQREGLLQPGARQGRSVRFGAEHVERLERIRALQAQRFSLAAIRALLDHEGSWFEQLLGRPQGASYDQDELVERTGLPPDFARGLEKSGILAAPEAIGHASYDGADADALQAFAELRELGIPDPVLLELAEVIVAGAVRSQAEVIEVFGGRGAVEWPSDDHDAFMARTVTQPTRVFAAVSRIRDYAQRRNLDRLIVDELRATDDAPAAD